MTTRITVTQVRCIYDENIQAGVLRDPGLLDAAVNAPFLELFGVDRYPTLAQKAGKLLHGIQKAQAYSDGNKRLAWHSALLLLELNGQALGDIEPAQVNTFVRSLANQSANGEALAAEWLNDRMIGLV